VAAQHNPLHHRFVAALDETWRDAPLGRWMAEHREEFARLLRPHRSPPWGKLAAAFAAAKLADGRGRMPDAETTRRTWQAVSALPLARHRLVENRSAPGALMARRPDAPET